MFCNILQSAKTGHSDKCVWLGVECVCVHCPVYLIPFVVIIIVCHVTNRRHH